MPTVRAALDSLESGLFVDRHAESQQLVEWLSADAGPPEIMQIVGHAGVGKSALLRQLARVAPEMGRRPIVNVDGEMILPTPDDFARAVTGDGAADPVEFLGADPALLIIDSVEALAPLTRWLTTSLVPSLNRSARLVIAGRQPVGPMWRPWTNAMRTIRLESLSRAAATEYLERRGVAGRVADQILIAAGGYPLALTLAADLAVEHGVRHFRKAPEWNLTLRGLVDELVKDAPDLRSMLDAAATVRQFDEPTLAAVTGLDDASKAFAQLCAVSFIRPAQHGLSLHEDVRRVVIEELQWRNPMRLAELRRAARTYYRDRIRERRPGEDWLVPERVYLWEKSVYAAYMPGDQPSPIWVEEGGPDQMDELLAIHAEFVGMIEAGAPLPTLPADEETSPDFIRAVVELPGTDILIARTPDGEAHGFGYIVPLSRAFLGLLPPGSAIANTIERGLPSKVLDELPATAEGAPGLFMGTYPARGERFAEAIGALSADTFRYALRGGIFLSSNAGEMAFQVSKAIGMTQIPDVGVMSIGPGLPVHGWTLDFGRIGPDAWLDAVTSGQPLPPSLSEEELEKELHQVLVNWRDDDVLGKSPLAQLAALEGGSDTAASPPDRVRSMVRGALASAREGADDEVELACRALELAYMERKVGHEAIAERLNVSRSTFYRLIHRAEREIVAGIGGVRAAGD